MSNKVQSIINIGPMDNKSSSQGKAADPVTLDYEQGKRFFDNGNLAQAAMSFHNALIGYEEKGDKTGIANASNQLGHVCLAKEDYVGAEKHYLRTWDLCTEFNDPMSLFALSKRFIEVYRGLKEYDKAVKTCLDVLDTYHANNNPKGTVETLETMAEIYIEAGKQDKAIDAYKTIASIHRNFKHISIAESFEKKAEALENGE